ncbi:MAG: hypothetical protein COA32_17540 [Fluviicola sp.]|nr:MAG: hypothetical protein COA32_17540 [Fluviicola sp.]
MRLLLTLATIIIFSLVSYCQSVEGIWKTYNDETGKLESEVKLYKKNGKIYGKIIKLYKVVNGEKNPVCDLCPGYRKNKPVVGLNIITGLSRDGSEWYADESILDPNNGEIYDCRIWLVNKNKLAVRGYLGWFFRTQYWVRVD